MRQCFSTFRSLTLSALSLALSVGAAQANICDYRLSQLITGDGATRSVAAKKAADNKLLSGMSTGGAVVAGAAGASTATGGLLSAAGFYTLTNSITGATMLGSTWAGSSAAGTVGIIAGTGSGVGAAAAAAMNPVGMAVGAVVVVVTGGPEVVCYFMDERITDYKTVYGIMAELAENANSDYFRIEHDLELSGYVIVLYDQETKGPIRYLISNLYIVNGVLKNRDWFLNTSIGNVSYMVLPEDTLAEDLD